MKDLRDVRHYHWTEAMYLRKGAESLRPRRPAIADAMDRIADTHISCIQVLNEYVSGTAEADSIIKNNLNAL